jgi:hypothetical protein
MPYISKIRFDCPITIINSKEEEIEEEQEKDTTETNKPSL